MQTLGLQDTRSRETRPGPGASEALALRLAVALRSRGVRRADGIAIEIDTRACAGAGECAFRAPHTFRLGDDGKAAVADPDGDDADAVLLAARTCPSFAIAIRRDGKRLA